ncbi:hypothetical protein ADS79_20425 [Brevibacillus reuszeri]|uniref:Uncharacterized protein n=1 Tax=Brevibacillus reuszeri TaxID=54915 RepID=A0A0K9YRB1_9BACL|nr:hypothetical protein ADS79_20425 [Brevibacillus reuszeri]
MENFPIIVLLIGLLITLFSVKYPRYRNLTLIGSGALPCVLYSIQPSFWWICLILLVITYCAEFWKIKKGKA